SLSTHNVLSYAKRIDEICLGEWWQSIGNIGVSSKFDASLNNVTLGNLGTQSTTTFNNLPNGSMGSFGVTGASVTDFKMKVSGF
ncbi:hypothetical protein KTJ28_17630, partial [Acinetobacter baumannii]|nr:hypothetical protein [Acinetobacter baumannii]